MKHQTLNHWKFRNLHRALGCESIAHTAGHLELLWLHCQQSKNGPVLRKDEVELICDWTGEPGKLVSSLLMFTWLDVVNGTELVEVHDFADHAPAYVRRRDYMADYMREYRQKKKEEGEEVKPALTNVNTRKCLQRAVNCPTLPNQTKPNLTEPNQTKLSLSNDSKSDLNVKAHTKTQDSPAFRAFWKAYPRKIGKGAARVAWKKKGCEKLNGEIVAAIEKQKNSQQWTKDGGEYIPNPATWLNQERWDDEVEAPKNKHGLESTICQDIAELGW